MRSCRLSAYALTLWGLLTTTRGGIIEGGTEELGRYHLLWPFVGTHLVFGRWISSMGAPFHVFKRSITWFICIENFGKVPSRCFIWILLLPLCIDETDCSISGMVSTSRVRELQSKAFVWVSWMLGLKAMRNRTSTIYGYYLPIRCCGPMPLRRIR